MEKLNKISQKDLIISLYNKGLCVDAIEAKTKLNRVYIQASVRATAKYKICRCKQADFRNLRRGTIFIYAGRRLTFLEHRKITSLIINEAGKIEALDKEAFYKEMTGV